MSRNKPTFNRPDQPHLKSGVRQNIALFSSEEGYPRLYRVMYNRLSILIILDREIFLENFFLSHEGQGKICERS